MMKHLLAFSSCKRRPVDAMIPPRYIARSDIVCLRRPSTLADTPSQEFAFLARRASGDNSTEKIESKVTFSLDVKPPKPYL